MGYVNEPGINELGLLRHQFRSSEESKSFKTQQSVDSG